MSEAIPDTCEFCEGTLEQRTVRARFRHEGETIYIDGVPAWVCTRCGEQYYDAPVYKQMERIAQHRERITDTITFPLAQYDKVTA